MSHPSIAPVAKSLFLCDGHIGLPNQKTDLMGLFNAMRPTSYPYAKRHFVIFGQLIGGLGHVPFHIDIRFAADGRLIYTTHVQILNFPSRDRLVQLANTLRGCRFPFAGTYLVELFCSGQWVADTTLALL